MLSFVSNQVSQCHRLTVASDKKGVSSCLLWELDELAADCYSDGQYDFLLTATPIPFTHAVGGPVAPTAVK